MTSDAQANRSTLIALENAHLWHLQWKDRLRAAVAQREALDPVALMCDDCCDLGRWLYSDGQATCGNRPEYQDLLLDHREFHMLAGAIAEIINDKNYELATAYLSNDTQFVSASDQVSHSIRQLEAAVAQHG